MKMLTEKFTVFRPLNPLKTLTDVRQATRLNMVITAVALDTASDVSGNFKIEKHLCFNGFDFQLQ